MAWEVTDYVVWRGQSSPNPTAGADVVLPYANGQGAVAVTVPTGFVWLVTGMVVQITSPVTEAIITCDIFDLDPTPLLSGGALIVPCQSTRQGTKDVDDQGSPIIVPSGCSLWWVFYGADLGAIASVRLQYEVCQRAGSSKASAVAF